jgi:hypothetical protein
LGGGWKKTSLLTITIESIIIIIILFLKNVLKIPHLAKDPHLCCITKLKEKSQFESFLHSIKKGLSWGSHGTIYKR